MGFNAVCFLKKFFVPLELNIHRIKLLCHSNVCTVNGCLSCYLGSRGALVLWSLDVSDVAVSQLKLVA